MYLVYPTCTNLHTRFEKIMMKMKDYQTSDTPKWRDGDKPELKHAGSSVGGVLLGEEQQGRGAGGGGVPLQGLLQLGGGWGGAQLHEPSGPAHKPC